MPDKNQLIAQIYGIEFPDEFFQFWEFVQQLPTDAFRGGISSTLGISLGDIFAIFKPDFDPITYNPIGTSRYFNDPPEFFTILYGHTDGEHWGYYLEDPANPAWQVVSYYSNDAYVLSPSENLWRAIRYEIELAHRDYTDYLTSDPGYEDTYRAKLEKLQVVRQALREYDPNDSQELGEAYCFGSGRRRQGNIPTRDELGINLPLNLYRPLADTDNFQIWNYQPTAEEVEAYKEAALLALAEGYPGTALKLGKDLWVYEKYFDTTFELLDAAYAALNRPLLRRMLREAKTFRESVRRK